MFNSYVLLMKFLFYLFAEAGRYLGTSKQAVFASAKKIKKIMGKDIIWV